MTTIQKKFSFVSLITIALLLFPCLVFPEPTKSSFVEAPTNLRIVKRIEIPIKDLSNQNALNVAMAQARPGDFLILPDGLYEDFNVSLKGSGEAGYPITLTAATPGGVKMTGHDTRITIAGSYLVLSGIVFENATRELVVNFRAASNSRVTDCVFINSGDRDSIARNMIYFWESASNNRVDHNYIKGSISKSIGIKVADWDHFNTNNKIDYNYFHDIISLGGNGQESIGIGSTYASFPRDMHTIVEYNLFENASGDGEIISSKSSSNVIRYNTFRNCNGEIVLRGGNNCLVEGNFIFHDHPASHLASGGVRFYGTGHIIINNYIEGVREGFTIYGGETRDGSVTYSDTHDCTIANNTLVNTFDRGIYLGRKQDSGRIRTSPHDLYIYNNIISSNRGTLIYRYDSNNITWDNNISYATGSAQVGYTPGGVAVVNPLLVDNGIYRLSDNGSPAINSATVVEPVIEDIDGQLRDDKPDVGCDELSSSAKVRGPLRPQDVGPSWMDFDS